MASYYKTTITCVPDGYKDSLDKVKELCQKFTGTEYKINEERVGLKPLVYPIRRSYKGFYEQGYYATYAWRGESSNVQELEKYFYKKNIVNENGEMLIVDIGWRGTIQDNIAYIFPKKNITGYYITLYDFYNYQPRNTKKIKFIKNRDLIMNDISSIITVLEMLFSSNTGSVIEYKDGKAIRKLKKEEVQTVQNYIEHIQSGMLKGCKTINEYMKIHPYEASEFDTYIEKIIKSIKENPNKDLVEVYYDLVMNDTFGTGKYINKKNEKLGKLERLNIFKCRNRLRKELWKEAYIKYNHIEYINSLMGVKSLLRKITGRK